MSAIPIEPEATAPEPPAKKKLLRRPEKDSSQQLRLAFQLAFVALNAWIGAQFFLWVRHFETFGATRAVSRPGGIDGWLPIAGLMSLKQWLVTREITAVHPAGLFLIAAFITMSVLLKKAFCSWLCPVGTLSEMLWKLGRKIFGANLNPPRWLDVMLRGLKYLLLAFFVWAVAKMPADAIGAFLASPYGVIADVKLLNFFRNIGTSGAAIIGILVMLSIAIRNAWCRYLCPYGALLGIASLVSPVKIRRDADACIDCAKCAKACPSRLPVDVKPQIRSAECTMCLSCVAVCPARGALSAGLTRKRAVQPWAIAAAIAAIFLGLVITAKVTGHWNTNLPDSVYQELVPQSGELSH